MVAQDLVGKKFGMLKVISFAGKFNKANRRHWLCSCECGVLKKVSGTSLISGDTVSCGCFGKRTRLKAVTTHGQSRSSSRKTQSTKEHTAWIGMNERCYNENNKRYKDYGGRGIKVCDRWLGDNGFQNFFEDMGIAPTKNHSIDRFPDNDGYYEKDNCRWATKTEQVNNRRSNINIEYKGQTKTLMEWVNFLNLRYHTIRKRLTKGDSVEVAFETKVGRMNISRREL